MKQKTQAILICPSCRGNLELQISSGNETIETGLLTCHGCGKTYPIKRGVPHFIKEDELEGFNKPFARMYDWFSLIYSLFSKVGFLLLGTTDSCARQEIISRLAPRGRVLEVSIGPGVNLPFLLKYPGVTEVYGLDISIGQLNRCRSLTRRKHWPVDLFLANAEELPFTDGSFDSVFHIGGINFFSNKQKAIHELIRVAKPGTHIIICDENESGAEWYEKFLPGFKAAFKDGREKITAPIGLIPSGMLDVNLDNIWNGFMYCIEFQKP